MKFFIKQINLFFTFLIIINLISCKSTSVPPKEENKCLFGWGKKNKNTKKSSIYKITQPSPINMRCITSRNSREYDEINQDDIKEYLLGHGVLGITNKQDTS